MKSHSVQKLAGKPVIIITLTNPTKTHHTEYTLRQIDACQQAQMVYLIYDVTPLKLSSSELNQLLCDIQVELLDEAHDTQLKFLVVTSQIIAQHLIKHKPFQEMRFALFTSLDQALTYTTSKLVSSNGSKH
jgi:hypothetical protein